MTDIVDKLSKMPGTISYTITRSSLEELQNMKSEELKKNWFLVNFLFIFAIEEEIFKRETYNLMILDLNQ